MSPSVTPTCEPEAAIIIHMRTAYNEPERFSSFGTTKAAAEEPASNKNRGRQRKG